MKFRGGAHGGWSLAADAIDKIQRPLPYLIVNACGVLTQNAYAQRVHGPKKLAMSTLLVQPGTARSVNSLQNRENTPRPRNVSSDV